MLAAALVSGSAWSTPARSEAGTAFEPVGTWNCLFYGPYGDQRAYLGLAADGQAYIARIRDASQRRWAPLSEWRATRRRITFADAPAAREYEAETARVTLGGTWRSPTASGGWWCAPVADAGPPVADRRPPSPAGLMTELVPAIMASPNYPRQAIREAKEGRAVSCFFVYGSGDVSHAGLIELSDEIFRGPVLAAIAQSRYRVWGDDGDVRPACRTFTFELDTIR